MEPGSRFGKLVAIGESERTSYGKRQWLFRCDCGQDHVALLDNIKAGRTQSCGCAKRVSPPVPGRRYGDLVALHEVPGNSPGRLIWLFQCDCGEEAVALGYEVTRGHVKSCGCRKRRLALRHGQAHSPEYACWKNMINRCENQNHPSFAHYGGRGIVVCAEWRGDFARFLADAGQRPSPDHSLDRHPSNDGPYAPGNVRWATRTQQARNTSRNRIVRFQGEEVPLVTACERAGVPYEVARGRLRQGWDTESALGAQTSTSGA